MSLGSWNFVNIMFLGNRKKLVSLLQHIEQKELLIIFILICGDPFMFPIMEKIVICLLLLVTFLAKFGFFS